MRSANGPYSKPISFGMTVVFRISDAPAEYGDRSMCNAGSIDGAMALRVGLCIQAMG